VQATVESLLADGALVDLVIGFTVLEAVALLLYRRATGKGMAAHDFLGGLVSGLCLLLALRSALHAEGWLWVSFWLFASGVVHGVDLWRRWER
jgi:hypothetical protein